MRLNLILLIIITTISFTSFLGFYSVYKQSFPLSFSESIELNALLNVFFVPFLLVILFFSAKYKLNNYNFFCVFIGVGLFFFWGGELFLYGVGQYVLKNYGTDIKNMATQADFPWRNTTLLLFNYLFFIIFAIKNRPN